MPHPGLLHPEPLPLRQATANLYHHWRHSNTQRQVCLRLCGVSWSAQGFVWALWASLMGIRFGYDGECVISLVLSCCSKDLKWQTKMLQLGYSPVLFGKQRKVYPWGMMVGLPQTERPSSSCCPPFFFCAFGKVLHSICQQTWKT